MLSIDHFQCLFFLKTENKHQFGEGAMQKWEEGGEYFKNRLFQDSHVGNALVDRTE